MKTQAFDIPGLLSIELDVKGDARGFFVERFQEAKFEALGLPTRFVQDNHSRSMPGVLRGLHYQHAPTQGKLVGVTRGRILDVAVDIRPRSPTYGKHAVMELSDLNGRLLWIPAGFAHGFAVLGNEPADVMYKVDSLYASTGEGGIRWDDAELGVPWLDHLGTTKPVISARDQTLPSFERYRREVPAAFEQLEPRS